MAAKSKAKPAATKTKPKPVATKAKAKPAAAKPKAKKCLKMDSNNVYSRAYHAKKAEGATIDEARLAGNKAVEDAKASNMLVG